MKSFIECYKKNRNSDICKYPIFNETRVGDTIFLKENNGEIHSFIVKSISESDDWNACEMVLESASGTLALKFSSAEMENFERITESGTFYTTNEIFNII